VRIDTPAGLKRLVQTESLVEFTFRGDILPLAKELESRLGKAKAAFLDPRRIRIYGGDPAQIFDTIFQFSRDIGIGIEAASTIRPSLEDAFIKVAGLSPQVMAAEKSPGKGRG
jgi:ABC-2 type transport system ATP-binding protein